MSDKTQVVQPVAGSDLSANEAPDPRPDAPLTSLGERSADEHLRFEVLDRHQELWSLGTCLLQLVALASHAEPQKFLHDAVCAFGKFVHFDSGWWGELSADGKPPRNWTHGSVALSPTFAEEWNQIAHHDQFGASSIARLGEVLNFNGFEILSPSHPDLGDFCQRHGLFHSMAITLELQQSGLVFFVSLFRQSGQVAFNSRECAMLKWFAEHTLWHWQRLLATFRASRSWSTYALVDETGVVHYLGEQVGEVIDALHPGWSGTRLPAELTQRLGQRRVVWANGSQRLAQEPCEGFVVLSLFDRTEVTGLPPSEFSVAVLYSQGRTSKEIASLVGLAPATVRTYLSNAYRRLGVRNKFELMQALRARIPG